MTSVRKFVALSLSVTIAAIALAPVSAMAQGGCDWYAKTSLKQQSENVAKKCGFTGEQWSTNLQVHKQYCSSVPPAVWKKIAQMRKAKLESCK